MTAKSFLKKITPSCLLLFYHSLKSRIAAFFYNYPSNKMIVIGITGTKGKTTSANLIWSCLTSAGNKVGMIGTANIRIINKECLNTYHMTMPNPFIIQKLLKKMHQNGCDYAIIETTSEGIKQSRHIGINYDIAIFTNLYPEHLQSHGNSFENYKKTKGRLFQSLKKSKRKEINSKKVEKMIIVNNDDEHKDYFLSFRSDKKITFSINCESDYKADDIKTINNMVEFTVNSFLYKINILGEFNVPNALAAIAVAKSQKIDNETIKRGLAQLKCVPGRMELINEGQNFTVIVDYAHEKQSMTALLKTAKKMKKENSKIIVLLGAEGGGRDISKRPIMGAIAAQYADFVIISNVDPYDDDPQRILEDIAQAAEKNNKKRGEDLFVIQDRKQGIKKALSLANARDIILITGKGAEQSMIIKEQHIPWDDREIVRKELKDLNH